MTMSAALTLARETAPPFAAPRPLRPGDDDPALLRAAADAARAFSAPNPAIYWADMLASAAVGYAALVGAMVLARLPLAILSGMVAVLALYRAGMFIHELTHVKHSQLRGLRFGWNMIVGVPLLMPSFLYEGVHTLHHARTRYGTLDDPEYLPLALMKPWTVPLFVLAAAFAPPAMIVRFGLLAPLSAVVPRLRAVVVGRFSALSINPAFRRRPPEGELRRQWLAQETAASLWAIALVALVVTGALPLRMFLIGLAVASGVMVVNQVRTLVAHLWENDGEAMSVTAQYLDSVNVPPPVLLPVLWAPVGLRFHALHHLLPSVPYHALGAAHRRLLAALGPDSPYHGANHAGLPQLLARLVRGTLRA